MIVPKFPAGSKVWVIGHTQWKSGQTHTYKYSEPYKVVRTGGESETADGRKAMRYVLSPERDSTVFVPQCDLKAIPVFDESTSANAKVTGEIKFPWAELPDHPMVIPGRGSCFKQPSHRFVMSALDIRVKDGSIAKEIEASIRAALERDALKTEKILTEQLLAIKPNVFKHLQVATIKGGTDMSEGKSIYTVYITENEAVVYKTVEAQNKEHAKTKAGFYDRLNEDNAATLGVLVVCHGHVETIAEPEKDKGALASEA